MSQRCKKIKKIVTLQKKKIDKWVMKETNNNSYLKMCKSVYGLPRFSYNVYFVNPKLAVFYHRWPKLGICLLDGTPHL